MLYRILVNGKTNESVKYCSVKLVSNFSIFSSNHGGSCIFVWKSWQNKEINYLNGIGSEKVFETTVIELLDFKFTLAWTYRSPDGGFWDFFWKSCNQ